MQWHCGVERIVSAAKDTKAGAAICPQAEHTVTLEVTVFYRTVTMKSTFRDGRKVTSYHFDRVSSTDSESLVEVVQYLTVSGLT